MGDVPRAGGRQYFIERRGEGSGVIQDETFALAGERPVFELVGERELKVVLPAARPPVSDGVAIRIVVKHSDTDQPLPGVDVLMLYPNKTYREARTDALGRAELVLYARLPMTVFRAATGSWRRWCATIRPARFWRFACSRPRTGDRSSLPIGRGICRAFRGG